MSWFTEFLNLCCCGLLALTSCFPTTDRPALVHDVSSNPITETPTDEGPSSPYDVFINHRGEVKKTFVDTLYQFLRTRGFRTFVDYATLEKGKSSWPEIAKAIQNTKLFIVVLSRGYAESEWCLKELEMIMKKKDKRRILPVFFHVQPSEVRSTTSLFGRALSKHRPRYGQQQVEQWRQCLEEISQITGYRPDETNGFLGQLTDKVVSKVQELLDGANGMHIEAEVKSSKLFQERCESLVQLLNMSRKDKTISSGVYGKAGVGKSTLATGLYNRLRHQFPHSCLLLDVSKLSGTRELLEKLIRHLFPRENSNAAHVDQAYAMLEEHLPRMRCLIILDDLILPEHKRIIDIITKRRLGPGSRVVLTSRSQGVFDRADMKKEAILELKKPKRREPGSSSLRSILPCCFSK